VADFSYIRNHYKVPARFGRRVRYCGKYYGVIIGVEGCYLQIALDDGPSCSIGIYHPTWELEYLAGDTSARDGDKPRAGVLTNDLEAPPQAESEGTGND
jgi:hypothetical protein